MKSRFHSLVRSALPLFVSASCVVSSGFAQKTNSATKAGGTKEKPPVVPVEPPKSAFAWPSNKTVGKDPFFPRSNYPYNRGVVKTSTNTNNTPVVTVPDLELTGLSGTPENPLAVINNVTFGPGESRDVFLPGGRRLPVQCVEINLQTQTAVVQASGQRKTLNLKK